ncbi:hypothetical protein LTR56_012222 [Elasticomyces elasticus]|nr:hypothetical protein LTR56_012222 [Elasticomyces elasticus]KAK3653023.1 hypothetical protein LTR22_011411 [Elasticomyces elasticus]KAK4919579.1 hypothetical protein LTR49_012799 [Elasticomyces elasticus]KAK5763119.1 hypothetical protein LTS12_006708 [Elasticomyces elasticus]
MSKKKKSKSAAPAVQFPPPPTEPTNGRGVMITPRTAEELGLPESDDVFATLTTIKVPLELFSQQPWIDCPATHALGIPLKATRWPSENARVPNNLTLGLFMVADPKDEKFGRVQFRRMNGAVLVASVIDGGDVKEKDVEMMLMYLSSMSAQITAFVREERNERDEDAEADWIEERVERTQELAARMLTSEAFGQYVKQDMVRQV